MKAVSYQHSAVSKRFEMERCFEHEALHLADGTGAYPITVWTEKADT